MATWKTKGYRGYNLYNSTIQRVVICRRMAWMRGKLEAFPDATWPVGDDLAGARRLIDALLDRDLSALRALVREQAGRDLGVADYIDRLLIEDGPEAIDRRVLRRRHLSHGAVLLCELLTYPNRRVVRLALCRAGRTMATQELAEEVKK